MYMKYKIENWVLYYSRGKQIKLLKEQPTSMSDEAVATMVPALVELTVTSHWPVIFVIQEVSDGSSASVVSNVVNIPVS